MNENCKKDILTKEVKPKEYLFLDEHVEYREAIGLWVKWAQFRRQGLLFVTAAEAGVLAANTSSVAINNVPDWSLPMLGIFFAVIGLLNEIFLFDEMMNFKKRALALEEHCKYRLLSGHRKSVHPLWLFITRSIFRAYFIVWVAIFSVQLYFTVVTV